MDSNVEIIDQGDGGMLKKLPNATAILVLGIVGIVLVCCCGILGIVCSIIGLVLANKATKLYNENPSQWEGYNNVKTGRILCIIGIGINVIGIIFSIVYYMINGVVLGSQYMNSF